MTLAKLTAFNIGTIIRLENTDRSHVNAPYYAVVIEIGTDFFKTKVNNGDHIRTFSINAPEWKSYHQKRITIMGDKSEFGYLLSTPISLKEWAKKQAGL